MSQQGAHPRLFTGIFMEPDLHRILPVIQKHVNSCPMYLYHIKDKVLVSRTQLVDRITLFLEERIKHRASSNDVRSIDALAKKQSKYLGGRIRAGSAYAILSHRRYDVVRDNRAAPDDASSEVGLQRKGSYFDGDTASDGEDKDDEDTDDGDSQSSDDDANHDTDDDDVPPPKEKVTLSERLTPNVLKRLVKITKIEYQFLENAHSARNLDPSFTLTNCGLRIMVALHDVKFVNVSTRSERHTYLLTVFKKSDTKVNLRWQGDPPAADRVTARWKVAVVGGFSNNVPFAILLREGATKFPPRYYRLSSAVFEKIPNLDSLTEKPPKTVWIQ
ncbi:hypothetical protein EYR38_000016 [Pleurotus pulmonarius]|nr:hypothetical protein EYR38_000016 [Pleurotus pulmonarius]